MSANTGVRSEMAFSPARGGSGAHTHVRDTTILR